MKRAEFEKMINRYATGLTIISNAQDKVVTLQQKITEDEPVLQQLSKDLEVQKADLDIIQAETEAKKAEVTEKKAIQDVEVEKLQKMKDEIMEEKKETEAMKKSALASADKLNKNDINEVSG